MTFTTKKRVRARLALLMVVAMLLSLVPSTGVMAAEPHNTTTEAKVPSLRILFSASYYAKNNPDVYAAFGDNPYLLYQHYINYGIHEGRQYLSPILDVRAYRAGNPDLEKAFGDNWEQYLWHFMNYGVYEVAAGLRAPKGVILNVTEYLRGNPDVWRMTGGNLLMAIEHYVNSGMPLGSWVNAQYTAGPAIAHDSNVTSNTSSANNNGNNGNSNNNGGNGGNGGGTKPNPTPDKPTPPPTVDPDPPVIIDPVEHEHTKDSFDSDGNCKVDGCDYTLVDFQRDCKIDHSAIEIGHFCLVCGAEGTNDPTEEHTRDSLHTKNSFDENGVCGRGCGLTLAEFQAACTEDHEALYIGQVCSNCNYEGTLPYNKDECPNAVNHEYGKECALCDYAGECQEDHSAIYTTKTCTVCGEHGTKVCEVDHTEIFEGVFCEECGVEGTKPKPEVCENEANHGALHKGQNCPGCGFAGEADHTWDKTTGECSGEGCNAKCPNIGNHEAILQGETCGTCGYEGTKEPAPTHPENYVHSLSDFVGGKCGICGMTVDDFQEACESEEHETLKATGGTCSICGKQIEKETFVCPNAENHKDLHKGVACSEDGCDYIGVAEHEFENGNCTGCDATCTVDDCPDKDNHENILNTATCPTCGGAGTKEPPHVHDWSNKDGVCKTCGEACKEVHVSGEECGTCGYTKPVDACTEADHAKLACGEECPNCDYVAPAHNYSNGVCTRCDVQCSNWDNHAALKCGAKCADCDYTDPVGHQYENGQCKECGTHCTVDDCPDKAGHDDIACGSTCTTCGTAMPGHSYTEVDGAWVCTRCGDTCPHSFHEGTCSWCGATCTTETCPNAENHEKLQAGEKCLACNYVKPEEGGEPAEHVHDWENGTCKGEGECPGCPDSGEHANIPATGTCGTCGAAGTKPVYAHTENDGHEHNYVDNYCTECGAAKVGFGSSEEELDDVNEGGAGNEPGKSDGTGSTAAGGNSGNEDGTEGTNDVPDALPVEIVVSDEQKSETEPDPDDEDEGDDLTGGGDDDNEDEDEQQDSEADAEEAATS